MKLFRFEDDRDAAWIALRATFSALILIVLIACVEVLISSFLQG